MTFSGKTIPGSFSDPRGSRDEAARRQEVDARRATADLRDELHRLQSDAGAHAQAQAATGITIADAAAARSHRETLWAAHLNDLSATTAHRFEQALREDDRISSLLAEAMAEARREALQQTAHDTVSAARLDDAQAGLEAAVKAQQTIGAAVRATCVSLGLQDAALTLAAERGYDSADFVAELRQMVVTPHVARKSRHSAFDGRTTRHPGYARSQRRRKKIEEPFGWVKTVGGMAQTLYRGIEPGRASFTLAMAACNLARLPRLLAP